ncbi:MAG: hypothetical protein JHC33_03935 [Ignisphaera sp.]|nr:hypothetical protein [Ignisphaera sp.]
MDEELSFILHILDQKIAVYDELSTPTRNVVTEFCAEQNRHRAATIRKAKVMLIECHNRKFADGVGEGLAKLADAHKE